MSKLVLGPPQCGKTMHMLTEIKERIERGDKDIVIIVPEQSTMMYERLVLEVLGNTASAHLEVLSFIRFARRMFLKYSSPGGVYARSGTKQLVMSLALSGVSESLTIFKSASRREEFSESMISAVGDLKSYNITPEMLSRAAQICESERTAKKLSDISLIYGAYDAILNRTYVDPSDDLTRLSKLMSALESVDTPFYIDAFSGFTPQEYLVIEEIIRLSDDVCFLVSYDDTYEDNDLFSMTKYTVKKLESLFSRYERTPVCIHKVRENFRPEVLDVIAETFLTGGASKFDGDADSFCIARADDMTRELEHVSEWVLSHVKDGARFSDFLILSPDMEKYQALTETVFSKYRIPFYADKKEDMTETSPVRALIGALDAVAGGFSYAALFSHLKLLMGNYSYEEVCRLENYALMWGISGDKFLRPFKKSPMGRASRIKCEDDMAKQELFSLNEIRERIMEPFHALSGASSGYITYEGLCRAVYEFMKQSGFASAIERAADKYKELGDLRKSDEYMRIYNTIVDVLDEMTVVLSGAPCTLRGFIKMFRLAFSEYKLGSIPPTVDCVRLSSLERIISPNAPYVAIIGASEEAVPKINQGGGLFEEAEREELGRIGLVLSKSAYENASYDMFLIYCALLAPKAGLLITYPAMGGDGEVSLSQVISRACEGILKLNYINANKIPVRDRLYSRVWAKEIISGAMSESAKYTKDDRAVISEAARVLAEEEGYEKWERSVREYIEGKNEAFIRDKKNLELMSGRDTAISASRVEKFSSCRFAYYLNYVLGIKKTERLEFTPADTGTFVHYILEEFFIRIMRGGKSISDYESAEIDALIGECVNDYLNSQIYAVDEGSKRFLYLFGRLTKSLRTIIDNLMSELTVSSFVPEGFEFEIGKDPKVAAAVEGDGYTVRLYGLIDRVDVYREGGKTYLRVIDYKTGQKKFDLNDVTYGLNIQMLFYLFSVTEYYKKKTGDAEEAGVLYFHAYEPVVNAPKSIGDEELLKLRDEKLKRNGLVRADYELIVAMDNTIEGASKYIPVALNKDGSVKRGSSVASKAQFELIRKGVNRVIVEMVKALEAGSIEINPYERADGFVYCKYCDYKSVCRFDKGRGNNTRKIKHRTREEIFEFFGGKDIGG